MVNSAIGPFLILVGLIPAFGSMIATADFSLLTGGSFWVALGVAITAGLLAAVTAVGSGLNTFGTFLTFTLSFVTALYVALIAVTFETLSSMPYYTVLLALCSFCYAMGVFFLIGSMRA